MSLTRYPKLPATHYVTLSLALNFKQSSSLRLPIAWITGVCHHTQIPGSNLLTDNGLCCSGSLVAGTREVSEAELGAGHTASDTLAFHTRVQSPIPQDSAPMLATSQLSFVDAND